MTLIADCFAAWSVWRDTGDGWKAVGSVYTSKAAEKSVATRKAKALFGTVAGVDSVKFKIVKRA